MVCNLSGSGKSSLAFDTIFVEGQRRYIESLSHSASRFLHEIKKPKAALIEGISPTIAIEQKNINRDDVTFNHIVEPTDLPMDLLPEYSSVIAFGVWIDTGWVEIINFKIHVIFPMNTK